MQDRNLKNMEHDEFDKLTSSLLEGHSVPVDANCWTEIEKQIESKQRKHVWKYLSAAAVIGILMFSIYTLNDNQMPEIVITEDISIQYPTKNDIETSNRSNKLADNKENEQNNGAVSNTKQRNRISTSILQINDGLNTENKGGETTQLTAELDSDKLESSRDSIKVNKKKKDSKSENNSLLQNKPELLTMARKSKGWTFGVGMGTGGVLIANADGKDFMYDNDLSNGHPEIPNYNDVLESQEWDTNYNLPISFGFLIRKNINPMIGIESGIVYTYLSTDMKREAKHLSQKGTLQLYYLGIPVNAVFNLYKNSDWNVYLSAGITLEKGISSHQKTITYENSKEKTIDKKSNTWIRGAQWSMNGGVGISFGITKTLDLYIEPKVSYYFDNKQPMSIRTDQSPIFNINAGLKFNLK